jgi:non-heme chloroperoxidase
MTRFPMCSGRVWAFTVPERVAVAFVHTDFRSELTEVTVPTLVIHGTADASTSIDLTARKTASLIPDCRLVTIDGAGHGLYLSESPRDNAALLEFITSTRVSARATASG